MISFFAKKKNRLTVDPLEVDIHSHILPELDDGAETFEESLNLIRSLGDLGYKKIITTPHIMSGVYNNTSSTIIAKLDQLTLILPQHNISMEVQAAAEYYVDDHFVDLIDQDKPLLTLGKNYVLIETGFLNEPVHLKEVIFKLITKGYKPILAHPERYIYIQQDLKVAEELIERGVLLQLNINSLSGHYSGPAKSLAKKLIEKKMITFAGTDCHRLNHISVLQSSINKKLFHKLIDLTLLNNTLF